MKTNFTVTFAIVIFVTLIGCDNDEFFELERPPAPAWNTIEDLEFGAVSPYNRTFLNNWNNPLGNSYLLFVCMSDHTDLIPGTSEQIPFNELYNRWTAPDNIERLGITDISFNESYNAIGACNALLDFYGASNWKPFPEATSVQRDGMDRILGEAYFIRAFNYWLMALMYLPKPGDPQFNSLDVLPLRTSVPTNKEEAIQVTFGTGTQIFELITSDIDSAKKYLPPRYRPGIDDDSYEFGRANLYAAHALSMRVNFYLGGVAEYGGAWNDALADANFIINSGEYALDESPLTAWQNSSVANLGNEVIWYALYAEENLARNFRRPTSFNYSFYLARDGNRGDVHSRTQWNQFTWSQSALQQLGWFDESLNTTEEALNDQRYQELYWRLEGFTGSTSDDPRFVETVRPTATEPRLWCDKYYRAPIGLGTNIPIFRLSEVLLTRSILNFRTGNTSQALLDLNEIRVRSELEPLASISSEQDIHNERLKELAFEMDWMIYKISLRLPITEGDRDETIDNRRIEPPYEHLYYTIPQSDLDFKRLIQED